MKPDIKAMASTSLSGFKKLWNETATPFLNDIIYPKCKKMVFPLIISFMLSVLVFLIVVAFLVGFVNLVFMLGDMAWVAVVAMTVFAAAWISLHSYISQNWFDND